VVVAVIVSLREVVEELEALSDESTLYLDRETGELYALADVEARLVEDGAQQELPDWLRDEVPRIREVLASERWLSLPTRFDVHEWVIMEEFARAAEDPEVSDELLTAIHGRGAFRAFKDAVQRRGVQRDWYRHCDSAIADLAAAWLDDHGIAYTRDSDTP
jgi:hypothetical protein